jgi:pseudouridine synthase
MTKERLQKVLSKAGIASRRTTEKLVREGRVQVDGIVVTRLDHKADPATDHIRVDGRLIKRLEPKIYVLLNKPRGVLCTRVDPLGRPVVTDLIKKVRFRLYPVGRLDGDSEGLVILTNDGDFFQRVTHPRYQNPRTYLVKVKGMPAADRIQLIRRGVKLRDGRTGNARVELVKRLRVNSWWQVVVKEGRNRLVRRMFEKIGHPVIRLVRVKYGSIGLGGLRSGQYRHLTPDEVRALLKSGRGSEDRPKKEACHRVREDGRKG